MDKTCKRPRRLQSGKYFSHGEECAALKTVYEADVFNGKPQVICHSHGFYELAVVLRGTGWHNVEGKEIPMRPGSVFLLLPGEHHTYRFPEPLTLLNFMFTGRLLRAYRPALEKMPGYARLFRHGSSKEELQVDSATVAELDVLAGAIVSEAQSRLPGQGLAQAVSLVNALVLILRRCQGEMAAMHSSSILAPAISYMTCHFQNRIQMKDLARLVNLSEISFYRKFIQEIGQPPIQWLLKLRMRKAMEFLMRTDLTIAEVAASVGFNDPLYFSRQFSRVAGCSPREYRGSEHGRRDVFHGEQISKLY